MYFLHLSLLFCMLNIFSSDTALKYPSSSPTRNGKSIAANSRITYDVEPLATNIIFQSKDGGQTWQDISGGLPEIEQPEDFFAGESDLYLRIRDNIYRSKSNLEIPVWEKESGLDERCTSIAFNRSGVVAYNFAGQAFQKKSSSESWSPLYPDFKKQLMQGIFETSNGTVFLSTDKGLYKSADAGVSWKHIEEGWVTDLTESEGVLIGTSQNGIMRSTDNGEHWEWVIKEGGVGIAVENIDGGFAVISYSSSTKSRRIRISLDRGNTWTAIDEGLPPSLSISSIKQIGRYLLCGHPDGIFRSADMGKTWTMVHASVDNAFKIDVKTWNAGGPANENGKVFKLYVSRNVLYAVARNSGC